MMFNSPQCSQLCTEFAELESSLQVIWNTTSKKVNIVVKGVITNWMTVLKINISLTDAIFKMYFFCPQGAVEKFMKQ